MLNFRHNGVGPYRAYAPIFKKVAQELSEITINGKKIAVKYIEVDVDAASPIGQEYTIPSLPTTHFFKNGKKQMKHS